MPYQLKPEAAKRNIARARRRIGRGTEYVNGRGNFRPLLDWLPQRASDCTGLVADVLRIRRAPKKSRPFWIESTNLVEDATGKQLAFVRLKSPQAGCVVAYGDLGGQEGHAAIVTQVHAPVAGRWVYDGVDCSKGSWRLFREAILERRLDGIFQPKREVFMALRQDCIEVPEN